MSRGDCPRAEKLAERVRRGGDLGADVEHVEGCGACRDAVRVTMWLRETTRDGERQLQLPAAEAIWWRAQVIRRLCESDERETRRARPLALIHIGGVTVGLLTVIFILLGETPFSEALVGGLAHLVGGSSSALLMIAALVSLLTGAFLVWHFAEDLG